MDFAFLDVESVRSCIYIFRESTNVRKIQFFSDEYNRKTILNAYRSWSKGFLMWSPTMVFDQN